MLDGMGRQVRLPKTPNSAIAHTHTPNRGDAKHPILAKWPFLSSFDRLFSPLFEIQMLLWCSCALSFGVNILGVCGLQTD
jgi:hypothetical protein